PELASRQWISVVTKADVTPEADISAVTGEGLPALLGRLADMVDEAVRDAPERDSYVLHRPADEGYRVSRRNGTYVAEGRTVSRWRRCATRLSARARPGTKPWS